MVNEKCSPRTVTSRRRIRYRQSAWRVHHFEVWSEELVCRAAAVRMQGSVLVWVGGAGEPRLQELGVAFPEQSGAAVGTSLTGGEGWPVSLARRLATLLSRPVFVCCGVAFDRFTAPLIERGLIAEIKSRPECF